MQPPEAVWNWLTNLAQDRAVSQLVPYYVVLLLCPLLALLFTRSFYRVSSRLWAILMVLESFGFNFPWSWGAVQSNTGTSHEAKKLRKKHIRSRNEQLELNGYARPEARTGQFEGYYPGLVNISGTYCFMNATLQAMASLSYLQPFLAAVHEKAVRLDVPSPVVDALLNLLSELNTPRSSYYAIRPIEIINALSSHSRGKHNLLFSSREHQDAQELFQLVSECIKREVNAVDREGQRDRGLGGLSLVSSETNKEIGKSVFDGLTANRRSCVDCGYTEAVMHFAFDSWQLALPRYAEYYRLEDCLAEYTKLELLTDCICRKCSMTATHRRLQREADQLEKVVHADPHPSISKKRRARDTRKMELKVKAALENGRLEEDIKGLKLEKVLSKASTKQAMIARPPLVLALHLNRSLSYGHFVVKNNVRVVFPEILELTPFTTSGNLSIVPSVPICSPPPTLPRSATPTQAMYSTPRTIYRLVAVVCHYGQHSFGHYVCYRRKPRPPSCGAWRFAPPRFADPVECDCEKCMRYGNIRDDDDAIDSMYLRGRGWLRISDDSVKEVGIESVLQEGCGAFMLYYERVVQSRPGIYPLRDSPRSSEETLKPRLSTSTTVNASTASLASMSFSEERERGVRGARIVRSVVARRGRSTSATPSEQSSKTELAVPNGSAAVSENGNGVHLSSPLKMTRSQVSLPSMSSSVSQAPSLSALAPDLHLHRTSSASSSHSFVSSTSHHHKPSAAVDLKA